MRTETIKVTAVVAFATAAVMAIISLYVGVAGASPDVKGKTKSAWTGTKKSAVGVVESVDETSRTIAVKTADGAVVVAEWTKDTSVTVAHATANAADATADKTVDVSKDVAWGTMKGANVAIEYTEKAGKKTVHAVKNFGEDVPEMVEGTVESVSDGGRTVAIKTKDGSIKVYEVSKDATIWTGKKVVKGSKVVAGVAKDGTKKVVHFFKGN